MIIRIRRKERTRRIKRWKKERKDLRKGKSYKIAGRFCVSFVNTNERKPGPVEFYRTGRKKIEWDEGWKKRRRFGRKIRPKRKQKEKRNEKNERTKKRRNERTNERSDSLARREISFSFLCETHISHACGLCVFCLLLYHELPGGPQFYIFSLSPPARKHSTSRLQAE